MKNRSLIGLFVILAFCIVVSPAAFAQEDDEVRRISKEEARKLIEEEGVPIIDVRYKKNYEKSDVKIAGAVREDPNDMDAWVDKYPKEKAIILYCDWPNEDTSAGVAYELMDMGFTDVYVLKGGWWEWLGAGYPVEPK